MPASAVPPPTPAERMALLREREARREEEAERRRRLSAGRRAARRAREAAEGEPRPSKRGRPRLDEESAALYVLSVRLPRADRERVQAHAKAAGVSLAVYARAALLGEPMRLREVVVEVPSAVDRTHARVLAGLANNINQLTRAANELAAGGLDPETVALLRALASSCRDLLAREAPQQVGLAGRAVAAARLLRGSR